MSSATYIVPTQKRSERFRSTCAADFQKVTGREMSWKYAPILQLDRLFSEKLDGGQYEYTVSLENTQVNELPAGVELAWMDANEVERGQAGIPEERASAVAWEQTQRVLMITIRGTSDDAIILTRQNFGQYPRAAHTLVVVKEDARATLVFQNNASAHLSENIEFVIGNRASVEIVSIQNWDDSAVHLASHFAKIGEHAKFVHTLVPLGGKTVRVNPSITLSGARSEADVFGIDVVTQGRHTEHHVYVHHEGPHTRGNVNYKAVAFGQGARTVWIGDVLIGQYAVGTDSYEQNRNLLLDSFARADSVPNLEIETGDIVGAGHASATGRFDEDHLFYLQSRGTSEQQARRMIVQGFLGEHIYRISSETIRDTLFGVIEEQLTVLGLEEKK